MGVGVRVGGGRGCYLVKPAGEKPPSKDIPKALKAPERSDTRWGQEACASLWKLVCSTGHLLIPCGISSMWNDAELRIKLQIPSFQALPEGPVPAVPFPFSVLSGLWESAVTIVSTWSAFPLSPRG